MHPSVAIMYGRPKLIEFVRRKSPELTNRDFERPSGLIFSFVTLMNLPLAGASPILIQLSPVESLVRNFSIGRGDPPRAISKISPRRLTVQCAFTALPPTH